MAPTARRFADIGAPELAAKVWFASLLRDGFALTSAGATERLAVGALRSVLSGVELTTDMGFAVQRVMDGFSFLEVYPDVPDGVRALATSGVRLVTLTNGSTDVAERLFTTAGTSSVCCQSRTPVCGSPRRAYRHLMSSDRVQRAENSGARRQPLLWASTKTKDPEASDTLYVHGLAAPYTINTMPDETLKAFYDHGEVAEPAELLALVTVTSPHRPAPERPDKKRDD